MPSAYREFRAPSTVRSVAACVWEHQPTEDHLQRVVPDGCVDLLWLAGRGLQIAGADTGPRIVDLVLVAARLLAVPGARVSGVAANLGVTERQLHRRTLAAGGYGPKVLARVGRLRQLIAQGGGSLPFRALDAGYASQAHMTEEVRRLTGTTPVRFLKDATLTTA